MYRLIQPTACADPQSWMEHSPISSLKCALSRPVTHVGRIASIAGAQGLILRRSRFVNGIVPSYSSPDHGADRHFGPIRWTTKKDRTGAGPGWRWLSPAVMGSTTVPYRQSRQLEIGVGAGVKFTLATVAQFRARAADQLTARLWSCLHLHCNGQRCRPLVERLV